MNQGKGSKLIGDLQFVNQQAALRANNYQEEKTMSGGEEEAVTDAIVFENVSSFKGHGQKSGGYEQAALKKNIHTPHLQTGSAFDMKAAGGQYSSTLSHVDPNDNLHGSMGRTIDMRAKI